MWTHKLQLKLEIQREATKKIAFNIKHDSKSFYAYVRSKQKVQDKVGPLEGSDGNIITGILNGRVDGIPPKLLLEIVEQISIPLATVFNLSLEEGIVPLEWKEANIIPLF